MGEKIGRFLTQLVGPGVIIHSLKQQNGRELGKDFGRMTDKALDSEFGDKKSEQIQDVVIPFSKEFLEGFIEGLNES